MGHIKRGDLNNAQVLISDNNSMLNFTIQQNSIIEKIILNNRQIKQLVKLRDLLLPKLMSGEIRLEN